MTRTVTAAALILSFVATAAAVPDRSLIGVWKGRILLDLAHVPGSMNASMRASLKAGQAKLDQSTVTLTLSPNHRFVMRVTGAAARSLNNKTAGKWMLQGDELTLQADQKATHKNPFKVSPNGKSFSMSLAGGEANLKFTR